MAKKRFVAKFLGFDLSTTALSALVRGERKEEDFVSIPMRGAKKWLGQPAFDLSYLPDLILDALETLRKRGWDFSMTGGALSFSVRQHDMALTDERLNLVAPAFSWQCNAAVLEAACLRQLGVEKRVGKIEERFILPKLAWLLRRRPGLRERIQMVLTTGDYIAAVLTGNSCLSTSDALSNGLLAQKNKRLAKDVLTSAGFNHLWFPEVIQSGKTVGFARPSQALSDSWGRVAEILNAWQVIASLGDNHAGGVGCGLADNHTVVISAGSSGTVIRKCRPGQKLRELAACFEYYRDRLLLLMLHECAVWYTRFVEKYGQGRSLPEIDRCALEADPGRVCRVKQERDYRTQKWHEVYPRGWSSLSFCEKAASTQASIAIELMLLVKQMLEEVINGTKINRFVITGGLSRALFFQQVLRSGLSFLVPGCKVLVSDRSSPFAVQAATLGALINAMVGSGFYPSLPAAVADLCPLREADRSAVMESRGDFQGFLARILFP